MDRLHPAMIYRQSKTQNLTHGNPSSKDPHAQQAQHQKGRAEYVGWNRHPLQRAQREIKTEIKIVCLLEGTRKSAEPQLPNQAARTRTCFGSRAPLLISGDPGARRRNLVRQWTSHGTIQNACSRGQFTSFNRQQHTSCHESE
jgi:hypothetical protein